ncbi:MAG: HPr family phosphocarrier protein [Asticcacaulis sp.]
MNETVLPARATVEICNNKGLHARASAKFVKLASAYDGTQIHVIKDDNRVDALSIMGLLMLAAAKGSFIEIEADGPQAQEAVEALVALVNDRFGEEA